MKEKKSQPFYDGNTIASEPTSCLTSTETIRLVRDGPRNATFETIYNGLANCVGVAGGVCDVTSGVQMSLPLRWKSLRYDIARSVLERRSQ